MKLTQQQKDRNKVKAIIRDAVKIFNSGAESEARNLWAVLSALRGPDSANYTLKQETTSKIRSVIGILNDNNVSIDSMRSKPESLVSFVSQLKPIDNYLSEKDIEEVQTHFASHYRYAVEALEKLGFIKS